MEYTVETLAYANWVIWVLGLLGERIQFHSLIETTERAKNIHLHTQPTSCKSSSASLSSSSAQRTPSPPFNTSITPSQTQPGSSPYTKMTTAREK
ncbi:hypothetical protein RU639_002729 [Aspergillus parasiticus]